MVERRRIPPVLRDSCGFTLWRESDVENAKAYLAAREICKRRFPARVETGAETGA
jgi:hypothetical protein